MKLIREGPLTALLVTTPHCDHLCLELHLPGGLGPDLLPGGHGRLLLPPDHVLVLLQPVRVVIQQQLPAAKEELDSFSILGYIITWCESVLKAP